MIPRDPSSASLRRLLRDAAAGAPIDLESCDRRAVRLLADHRLQPLVERSVRARAGADPRWADLLDAAQRLRLRSAVLRLELARLVMGLEEARCEPIVLKGAALAHTSYADPGDRYFADLDILVPKDRLEVATRVVEDAGYATSRHHRAAVADYDRHHFHRVLISQSGVHVELHWDLTRPASPFRFDLEGLRRRCRTIDAEGVALRVPGDGDQFLHAACQSAKDGFLELRRLMDATLLARRGALDDPELADRARGQGLATAAWLLARLAEDLLEARVPAGFVERLRPSGMTRRCLGAARIGEALLSQRSRRTGERQWVRWWCCPDAVSALRAATHFVFPSKSDLFDDGGAARPSLVATMRRAGSAARATAVLGARALRG